MTTRKILVATPTAPIAIDVNSSAAVSVTLSGARGANGYGVPVGGDAGAVLAKSASGDYLTSWLTTTAFGRGLLAIADAAGLRSAAGLANVDNTADLSKPVSTAQALAISAAVAAEATIRGSADTSEAGTRAAADTALDGRLDVLEADPITATAVASGLAGKLAIASNLSDLNNASTARTNLGLGSLATQSGTFSGTSSGTNTGDQTITLTGDVTGSGSGSFAATVAANAITNAKAAQMAAATIKGNNTGATANPADLTAAQVRGVLALPTSTVAGRVALYTDTAGSQGQSSAIFESAGNVGIGTSAPSSKLELGAGQIAVPSGNAAAPAYSFSSDLSTGLYRVGAARLGLSLGGTYLLDMQNGSLGVYGAAAGASVGSPNIELSGQSLGYKLSMWSDATYAGLQGYQPSISYLTYPIALQPNGGNVGIGTTSPGSKLEVAGQASANGGSAAAPAFSFVGDLDTGMYRIAANRIGFTAGGVALWDIDGDSKTSTLLGSTTGAGVGQATFAMTDVSGAFRLSMYANATSERSGIQAWKAGVGYGYPLLLQEAGGNVGIGTTAPRVKLDVSGPVAVGSYTVATVPSAALGAGQIIYVSNESGGATLAFSDGTSWRRTTDLAVIS